MDAYYHILQVTEHSSIDEIKKAYRKKAKEFHPDVNNSPTAEADFIKINEAYEYLINKKLGLHFDSAKQKYSSSKYSSTDWSHAQQEAAHKRAEYYAKKKYKDFVNSKFYKESKLIEDFASFTGLFAYFSLIFIFPFTLSFFYDIPNYWISLLIAFLTVHGWGPLVSQKRFPPIQNILQGALLTFRSQTFKTGCCFLVFIVVYFSIGFRTLITIYEIAGYILILLFFLVKRAKIEFKQENYKTLTKKLGWSLLSISLLLILNYSFAFNEQEEIYPFRTNYTRSKNNQRVKLSIVELKGDAYYYYPSIRFFFDYTDIESGEYIVYKIKRGVLFYRVYTHRSFL